MFDLKMLPLSAGMAVAAAVVMAPASAQAITLTDGTNSYEVTTQQGAFNTILADLVNTPWWGNSALAQALAADAQAAFGLPNIPPAGAQGEGPYFAFELNNNGKVSAWNWDGIPAPGMVELDTQNNDSFGTEYVWAVEDAAAVPTPALLPALLGMGASVVRKRKQQADDAAA